jgi:hypothetical protein
MAEWQVGHYLFLKISQIVDVILFWNCLGVQLQYNLAATSSYDTLVSHRGFCSLYILFH